MSRAQSVAQWTRQVALHAWPDDGDELAHRGVRNGRNTNDVAAKNQATHLSAGERSTQFGAIGNDQVAQCGEDSAPKEFTEKIGRVIVRHTGTDKGGESSSNLGVAFPHAQDASNEFLAGVVRIVAEIAKDYSRVDGPLQRGGEELVLGSEVVVHQRRIDLCLAQSQEDGTRLLRLGAPRVQVAGNLKYDVPAPPVDPLELAELTASIGSRPVWLAASTHAGEDEMAAQVHANLVQAFPDLLTIVVPRHAHRGPQIAQTVGGMGLRVALRSRGNPISPDVGFYIADTMGELGVFYRLANIVFVGKSIAGAAGGQNPIEPAKLGAAILHGPNVANFSDVYRELDDAHGAIQVGDADTLTRALGALFADSARMRRVARAAAETVERFGGATDNIMQALEPYFMQMRVERR